MWGNILSLSLYVVIISTLLFQSSRIFELIKRTNEKMRRAEELLFIFNIMKEDFLKSKRVFADENENSVILAGFLMYVSPEKNDSSWGIVLSCSEGKARVYNLNPKNFVYFIWNGLLYSKSIFGKIKISSDTYEITFQNCNGMEEGMLIFSDYFEIKWYSKDGNIIRMSKRYSGEDGSVKESYQVAGRGEIEVEIKGTNKIISLLSEDREFKITFSFDSQ
jgi:hypothetical protein